MTVHADAAAQTASPPPALAPRPLRLASLDLFRGLVIAVMTFVNYLSAVQGIPAWAKHWPETQEGYTFVDMVFPAFLFIVGVAIPLALHRRLAQGASRLALAGHALWRAAVLVFVGVLTVNSSLFWPEAAGLSRALWYLLAIGSVVLLWNAGPGADAPPGLRRAHRWVQLGAALLLVALLCVFRGRAPDGGVAWLQHSWWGILGMIGWAYLTCTLAWLLCRGHTTALMGLLGLQLALYIGDRHGALAWLGPALHGWFNVGNHFGSTPASVTIGMLVGSCFIGEQAGASPGRRLRFLAVLGIGLYVAGQWVRPLHGINKVAATEAYALVTGGLCCLLFAAVYYLADVRRARAGWAWLEPVGQNALLAYLLPGLVANLVTVAGLKSLLLWSSGWAGALNVTVLTALILALTWALTRLGLRLRL